MTTAAHAAEYKSNTGHDFTLADAFDEEFIDAEPERPEAPKQAIRKARVHLYGRRFVTVEKYGPFTI